MAQNEITTSQIDETPAGPTEGQKPATREEGRYLSPPVDIYEDRDSLVVVVDLPGVPQDGIHVSIDDGILTIRGRVGRRSDQEPLYSEFGLHDYHRQFQLSDRIDQQKISGELKHGVLTVRLPKSERVKPKKIEVRVGS
jgi:HSP20 family protein